MCCISSHFWIHSFCNPLPLTVPKAELLLPSLEKIRNILLMSAAAYAIEAVIDSLYVLT